VGKFAILAGPKWGYRAEKHADGRFGEKSSEKSRNAITRVKMGCRVW